MVDTFLNVDGIPSLLRIETTKEGKDIIVPPFVRVLKEATDDDFYASSTMAKQNYKMPESDKALIQEEIKKILTNGPVDKNHNSKKKPQAD